ncbi:MAG: hypothetical protein EZS28_055692, partial [Streblomastix strix]
MIVIYGISAALQLIVSNNIGYGNIDIAKKAILTATKFIIPYALLLIIVNLAIPKYIIRIFVDDVSVFEDKQFYESMINSGVLIVRLLSIYAITDIT